MSKLPIEYYIGVNYSIVWDVVKNKIPDIQAYVMEVIESESNKL